VWGWIIPAGAGPLTILIANALVGDFAAKGIEDSLIHTDIVVLVGAQAEIVKRYRVRAFLEAIDRPYIPQNRLVIMIAVHENQQRGVFTPGPSGEFSQSAAEKGGAGRQVECLEQLAREFQVVWANINGVKGHAKFLAGIGQYER